MTVEVFTATASCPRCGAIATHWLDKPRIRRPGQSPTLVRRDPGGIEIHVQGGLFDPPDTQVARICRDCGHRWAQQ